MKKIFLSIILLYSLTVSSQNIVITPTTAPLGYAATTGGSFTNYKFYYGNWKDSLSIYLFKSDTSMLARKASVPTNTNQLTNGSGYLIKANTDSYYKSISYVPTWGEITGKPTVKRIEAYRGVTANIGGNNGRYSVTYATPFATVPIVLPSIQSNSDYMQQFRIVSSSTAGFVVEVGARAALSVLAVTVLSSTVTPTNGIAIDIIVIEQ